MPWEIALLIGYFAGATLGAFLGYIAGRHDERRKLERSLQRFYEWPERPWDSQRYYDHERAKLPSLRGMRYRKGGRIQ